MAVREEAITDLGIEVADDLNIGKRTDVSVWPATASKSERGAKSALLLEMQQKLNASLSQIRQREEQGEEVDMHAQWRPYREVFQLFISRSTEYNDILTKVNKKVDEILRQYKFSKGRLAVHADKMEEVRTEMQQKADQMKTQYVKKVAALWMWRWFAHATGPLRGCPLQHIASGSGWGGWMASFATRC